MAIIITDDFTVERDGVPVGKLTDLLASLEDPTPQNLALVLPVAKAGLAKLEALRTKHHDDHVAAIAAERVAMQAQVDERVAQLDAQRDAMQQQANAAIAAAQAKFTQEKATLDAYYAAELARIGDELVAHKVAETARVDAFIAANTPPAPLTEAEAIEKLAQENVARVRFDAKVRARTVELLAQPQVVDAGPAEGEGA